MKPLNNNIIIEPLKSDESSLTEVGGKVLEVWKVVSGGESDLKKGDLVICKDYDGESAVVDGKEYFFVEYHKILGVK